MGNFPVHKGTPALLPHPAAATTAVDELEGRQIPGLVQQPHKTAGPQQLKHVVQAGRPAWGPGPWAVGLPCRGAGTCLRHPGPPEVDRHIAIDSWTGLPLKGFCSDSFVVL